MARKSSTGSVRIIAGQWRGRKLPVADVPGLRPSGDRARETLFNWLAPHLPRAVCADLFAGSGALGFEAASRGAARVDLIEMNRVAVTELSACIEMLDARQVSVIPVDAMGWLKAQADAVYDLVFADPPFESGLHQIIAQAVFESGCLKPGGLLYVESPASGLAPVVPDGWTVFRAQRVGDVRMVVFKSRGEVVKL